MRHNELLTSLKNPKVKYAASLRERRERDAQGVTILEGYRELGGTGLASWIRPKGGYFIALDTLPGCATAVIGLAQEAGVKLTGPGSTFPLHHDPLDRNIRIAPSYPPLDELKTAIELFCICVKLAGVKKILAEKTA